MYAVAAKSLQSCLTLCDPIDGSPPGSPVPGILQARTLEWVAISFSKAWKWKLKVKSLSRVWLWATSWTGAYQAPPSMGFSSQEYWSGVPLPSPAICIHIFNSFFFNTKHWVEFPVLYSRFSLVIYFILSFIYIYMGFPGGSDGKESACNAGDLGLIPRLGRSPGEGNGNPLQYSCLENPMDRGPW